MGLFATLAASAGQDSTAVGLSASDGKPPSGPSSLPTAAQLYTAHNIDFMRGTISGQQQQQRGRDGDSGSAGGGGRRKFEVLTYQAVEVLDSSSPGGGGGGDEQQQQQLVRLPGTLQPARQARKHTRPNLGVWDCRLPEGEGGTNGTELVDRLLAGVLPTDGADGGGRGLAGAAPVLFAVDLSDPASVCPAVEAMRSALLRRYEKAGPPKSTAPAVTTRLSRLRAVRFGSAPQPKDGGGAASSSSSSSSADGRVALVLCCAVPPPPAKGAPAETFQSKQARGLVLYHLHRFASEVDCTLAFVRADGDASDPAAAAAAEGGGAEGSPAEIPSLVVSELAAVVRRVAAGSSPVGGDADADAEAESGGPAAAEADKDGAGGGGGGTSADDPASSSAGDDPAGGSPPAQPPIYPPGSHDDDLIGSVLLRNASCPGVWDAATDDLWTALPNLPPKNQKADDPSSKGATAAAPALAGDEEWLSKLAESVASLGGGGGSAADDAASVKSGRSKDGAGTKPGKKKKATPPTSGGPSEAKSDDPTSFFENLLKK